MAEIPGGARPGPWGRRRRGPDLTPAGPGCSLQRTQGDAGLGRAGELLDRGGRGGPHTPRTLGKAEGSFRSGRWLAVRTCALKVTAI